MSLNYTTYVSQLANMIPVSSNQSNFQTALPGCIDYAEQRILRALDLQATRVSNTSVVCSTSSRTVTLSTASGKFVVVEELNVLTPAGAVSSATRNPLRVVSKQFIDNVYPVVTGSSLPAYAALLNDTTVLLGPPPDKSYTIETVGTIRPTPLSSGNPDTFLSDYLPDLFMAASMVFMSAYMRNFGAEADDPKMAQSWENQFQTLFASADAEELRKMYRSQGWTSAKPTNISTPPRV